VKNNRTKDECKNQVTRPAVAFVIRHCGDIAATAHSVAYLSALRNYCRVCIPSCLRTMCITIDARSIITKLRDKKCVNVFKWRWRALMRVITSFLFSVPEKCLQFTLFFFFISNTRERVTRDYNLRLFRVVFEDKFHDTLQKKKLYAECLLSLSPTPIFRKRFKNYEKL